MGKTLMVMKDSSMFDFSEYYDWVVTQMPDNCKIIEVGVANGQSALYLADKLHKAGKVFTLYMVDNLDYGGVDQLNELWRNVADSGWHRQIVIIPKDSREAADLFNGNSIDFLFLDSSHTYIETRESILKWYDKLKDGAIFGGHDYWLYPEIKKAVDELIPDWQTRDEIPGQQSFNPEKILHIVPTEQNYGVWYFQKRFWLKLNN